MSTRAGAPRGAAKATDDTETLIADNRKAHFDYHVLETFEAGVQLLGTEVKGIREGKASLRDAYARIDKGELPLAEARTRARELLAAELAPAAAAVTAA